MLSQILNILFSGILLGMVYAVAALGLSLTMGIMGVVNVSHSAFVMLGSFLALELLERLGVDPIASFFIALPLFFAIGALVYQVIVRRVERAQQTQGLVALFGLMVLIESLGTMVWTTNTRVITSSYSNAHLTIAGATLASVSLIAGALALVLLAAFWVFLRYTLTGRAIRAMGQDRAAARSLGVDVGRLSTIMFGLGIASAGAAGVAIGMVFPFAPQTQIQWLAWAFLIVVLGGMGKVENTLAAALFVGLVQAIATSLLPFDYVYLMLYAGLAVVLVVRREGLVGANRRTI
jgi:branched-chain amino acid transport system permease protein